MTDLTAKIVAEFDASQVETGVEKTKRKMRDFGESARKSTDQAGEGLDKLKTKVDGTGKGLERTRAAFEREFQRIIATMGSAGDKAAELEQRMRMRGIDPSQFSGYLNQVRQLQKAQNDLGRTTEMSGAAMSAAMRNVPAQMTDIVVSLQGGQRPMTVLLQQGGQLKDMFGGVGNAARAMGTYLRGAISVTTVSAAAIAAVGASYLNAKGRQEDYNKVLALTNNAVGLTTSKFIEMESRVGAAAGSYGKARDALLLLAESGSVTSQNIQAVATAVAAMSEATGKDIGELAQDYLDLYEKPLEAAAKLAKTKGTITAATYAEAVALDRIGNKQGAVNLLQAEHARASTGQAETVKNNLNGVRKAYDELGKVVGGVGQSIKKFWDGVSPAEDVAQRIGEIESRIRKLNETIAAGTGFGETGGGAATGRPTSGTVNRAQGQLAAAEADLAAAKAEQARLEAKAKSAKLDREALEAIKEQNERAKENLTQQEKLVVKLREEVALRDKALKAASLTAADVAQINDNYVRNTAAARRQYGPKFTAESVFNSMLTQESGGRQFDNRGLTITSPKGALGIAQIMPATGPEAARLAGVEWSPERLKSDAEYGKKLGMAYFQMLLEKFDQDAEKAVAAYNGGHGRVSKLSKEYGDNWLKYMPGESQNYVSKVLGRLGKDSQGNYREYKGSTEQNSYDAFTADSRKKLTDATAEATLAEREYFSQQKLTTEAQKELAKLQASDVWQTWNDTQRESAAGAAAQLDAQQRLVKGWADNAGLRQRVQDLQAENAAYGQSKLAVEELALSRAKQTLAQEQALGSSAAQIKQLEEEVKLRQQLTQEMKQAAFKPLWEATQKETQQAEEQLQLAKEELSLIGVSAEKRQLIVQLRQLELDTAKQIAEIDKRTDIDDGQKEQLRAEARNRLRLRQETAAMRSITQEWQKTADSINESLTDALLRGFEDGKGFAQNFRDTLKNMVNTLVLRPVISFIVQPIGNLLSSVVSSLLGGVVSGAGGSGSGLGGLIGNASNAYSAYGALTGAGGNMGAISGLLGGNMSVANAAGSLFANTGGAAIYGDGISALLATNGAYGTAGAGGASTSMAAGAGMGALAAGGLFAAAMLAAEYFLDSRPEYAGFASASTDASRDAAGVSRDAAGITDLVNAHQPAPGTTASVGNGWTGILGASDRPTSRADLEAIVGTGRMPGTGQDISTSNLSGLANLGVLDWYEGAGYVDPASQGKWDTVYNAEWIRMSRRLAEGVLNAVTSAASIAGQDVDLRVIAGLLDEGKKDDLFGSLSVTNGASSLVNWEGKVGSGQEYLRGVATATLDAFDALELPKWADGMVAATREAIGKLDPEALGDKLGSTALAAVDELNAALAQTAAVLKQLGKTVLEFNGYSTDVIFNITQLMGGVEQFGSAYSAYVGAFYSEEEQMALLRRQLQEQFAALGVTMPDSIKGFRELMGTLDLNDEASQKLFASLLAISPEFARLANAVDTAAESAAAAAAKEKEAAEKAAAEKAKAAAQALADAYTAAKDNTDGSLAAYEKAQQKLVDQWTDVQTAAEDVAQEARGVFSTVHQAVRDLYSSVDSTRAMQADQGNAFISSALAAARATGVLPDQDALSDAISGARGGLQANRFATKDEYEAAQLVLAGKLSELEKYADSQLTEAERQAKYAKDQIDLITRDIELAQEQVAAIREGNSYLGSIAELTEMIRKEREAKEAASQEAAKGATGGAGAAGGSASAEGPTFGDTSGREIPVYATRDEAETALKAIQAAGGHGWARPTGGGAWEVLKTTSDWTGGLRDLITGGASGADVLNAAVGMTVQQLARAMGILDDRAMDKWLRDQGYTVGVGGYIGPRQSFAVGTNYVPRDMVAQLHEGERIIPKADNRALLAAVDGGGSDRGLVQVVATLQKGFTAMVRKLSDTEAQLKRLSAVTEAQKVG